MITVPEVIALGICLPIIDVVFVALRLWVKIVRKRRLNIDDVLISITLVSKFSICCSRMILVLKLSDPATCVRPGSNMHIW